VGAFGERLRREREMRGISLEEIVATTKIGRRLLLALEEEQFDLLPGGIFNKAYVRAYAKCVGMDEDEAVAQYLQAANETPPDTRVIAHQHASLHSTRAADPSGFPVVPVLILLAVIAGGIGGWKVYQDHRSDRQKQAAIASTSAQAPTASNADSPAAENGTSSTLPPQTSNIGASSKPATSSAKAAIIPPAGPPPAQTSSVAAANADGTFEVIVHPKDSAWVSIKSDGNYVVRGIIRPPDVKTIRAANQIVFYTGNAGAVEVSFNGKNVPLTGGPNEEQVLVFDPRGLVPASRSKTGTQ
jgi:cytoskeleton protein RodZ